MQKKMRKRFSGSGSLGLLLVVVLGTAEQRQDILVGVTEMGLCWKEGPKQQAMEKSARALLLGKIMHATLQLADAVCAISVLRSNRRYRVVTAPLCDRLPLSALEWVDMPGNLSQRFRRFADWALQG